MENDIDLNGEQIRNDFREYQQELKKREADARRQAKIKFIDDYLEKYSLHDINIPMRLFSVLRDIVGDIYDLKQANARRTDDIKLQ